MLLPVGPSAGMQKQQVLQFPAGLLGDLLLFFSLEA